MAKKTVDTAENEIVAPVASIPTICEEYQQGHGGRYTHDENGNLVRVVEDEVKDK